MAKGLAWAATARDEALLRLLPCQANVSGVARRQMIARQSRLA
jgi:hypothetical protein